MSKKPFYKLSPKQRSAISPGLADYLAVTEAIDANTRRLRAERLAREEAERAGGPPLSPNE